jgi:hypothetical protein
MMNPSNERGNIMRNLTITRQKSFVASLVKLKVYIEDPVAGELTINNIRCRKLGTLKNGETKTFVIDDWAAKVFVISDKLSRNYSNDYFQLPEGPMDICLTGKNDFNPASGNAFRFDNNQSPEAVAHRKKGMNRGLIVLAVAAVVGCVAGFIIGITSAIADLSQPPEPKTFTCQELQLTLTDEFISTPQANFTFAYGTEDVVVLGTKEDFATYPVLKDYTVTQYADLFYSNVGTATATSPAVDDFLTYFTYDATNPDTQVTYHYVVYVYRTDEAFWSVQFATETDVSENYTQQISQWAHTVTFKD